MSARGKPGEQTIEQLQQRYGQLNTRKIQAETNLDNARKQLDLVKNEARSKFGTDDLQELKQKLADVRADNEKKRREYQEQLDRIDRDLQEVESRFAAEQEDAAEEPF
jgi:hypothetical protein